MSVLVKTLIPAKQAENVQTTQYTATNCKTIIDKFTATNTSAGNVTISVNLVTSGGSAGVSNLVVDTRAIAPDETYTFPELVGQVLESGGFISTIASAATSLTIRASGREIT
jgi:3-deoxy-D-manno-octulosonic acid (KDO) 8-phosphate synthase